METERGDYCATAYSRHDISLIKDLAKGIPRLRCLPREGGEQKGIYIFLEDPQTGEKFPEIEVYDRRLAARIRANLPKFKGDF